MNTRPHLVVAAVSNPQIGAPVLEIAASLVDRAAGKVVAVYVPSHDTEEMYYDQLKELVDETIEKLSVPIEMRPYPAESIARGILDAAREEGADLLVIGAQNQWERDHPLGLTVENVVRASPCPVMIFYAGNKPRRRAPFERLIVPVDGDDHSRVAVRAAALIAEPLQLDGELFHIARRQESSARSETLIAQSAIAAPDSGFRQTVLKADNPVEALLARLSGRDLLVMGFARRTVLEKWLFGSFSHRLISAAPFPILLVTELDPDGDSTETQFGRRVLGWLAPRMTDFERDEVVWRASQMALPSLDYVFLMALAGVISAAGLLLDSVALIIAAMILAPMGEPITAFAVGLATGRRELLQRSAITTGIGLLITLALGVIISLVFGWLTVAPTDQMQIWSHPTLLDAMIAGAAGAAGAYAIARKSVGEAIAGVAVATSLNPAISMIGISLSGAVTSEVGYTAGAALLFATNFICISLAGWSVFTWLGMRTERQTVEGRRTYWSIATLTLLALPVIVMLLAITTRTDEAARIRQQIATLLSDGVVDQVTIDPDGTTNVRVTVYTVTPELVTREIVGSVERALEAQIERPVNLSVIVETLIMADSTAESEAP